MSTKILDGLDVNSQRITSVADPSSATDAVNLATLQTYFNGLDNKASVRAASTANGTLATAFEDGDTLDGVTLATGDRILLKNQSTGADNGIYIVAASGAPTRATDSDINAEVTAGLTVFVSEGTTHGNTTWQLTTDDPIVVGTTALVFTQIAAGISYTAGDGLTLTGADFSVNVGAGIELSSDAVRIAAAAAGAGLTGGAGSALAVGAGDGITVNANDVALASTAGGAGLTYTTGVLAVGAGDGITVAADAISVSSSIAGNGLTYTTGVVAVGAGTGISVAADSVAIDTSVVARKYATSIGNGSSTSIAVTHNLGTKDVTCSVRQNSDDKHVMISPTSTDTNTLTFDFPSAPSSSQYRVTVIA